MWYSVTGVGAVQVLTTGGHTRPQAQQSPGTVQACICTPSTTRRRPCNVHSPAVLPLLTLTVNAQVLPRVGHSTCVFVSGFLRSQGGMRGGGTGHSPEVTVQRRAACMGNCWRAPAAAQPVITWAAPPAHMHGRHRRRACMDQLVCMDQQVCMGGPGRRDVMRTWSLRFSRVAKLLSPSDASSAEPTFHGSSLP